MTQTDLDNSLQQQLDFLGYATEFLGQFAVTAQKLKLFPAAYYLGMAALECDENLTKLHLERDLKPSMSLAA